MLVLVALMGTAHAEVSLEQVPEQCRAYAWIPADARDDVIGWNQLLSLASCLQGGALAPVTSSDELAATLDRETRALEIPTMIYATALEEAPGPVQLRAAYQLGMMHVALIVRVRSAIASPELTKQLDSLSASSYRLARLTFGVIDRAVTRDPTLAPDAVTQNMVRSARAMLTILPEPTSEEPDGAHTASTSVRAATDARIRHSTRHRGGAPRRARALGRRLPLGAAPR